MNQRQVPNILFPAIVVSSAVFGLLTLPFFQMQGQSPNAKVSILGHSLQPILATQDRDLTIRYIGGAMVVSVMVGFGTVELRRRWMRPAFPASATLIQADAAPVPPPKESPEITHLPPEWLQSDLAHQGSNTERWPLLSPKTDTAVVELPQVGEICRICVQPSQRRLFATKIGDQYYSFFQSVSSREAAWEIAQQLSQSERQVLITPVEQDYAVWVFQPQAERDLSPVV